MQQAVQKEDRLGIRSPAIAMLAPRLPADPLLPIAQVVPATEAEGPGRRFAVWLQGCPLRCPGCCNPEMLPFTGGRPTPISQLLAEAEAARRDTGVEGLTFLGGEPFAHAASAGPLARQAQQRGFSVMVFSGYRLEEIRACGDPAADELLRHTDLLVDGPYIRELPDSSRRWIGSTNQQIHFLSPRYHADDPCWRAPNTLELRLVEGELVVNGFPAVQARPFWRRPPVAP